MKNRAYEILMCVAFFATFAMACTGSKPTEAKDAEMYEESEDEEAAEISDGKFRPDTAKIFYDGAYDEGSTFVVISKKELRLNVYATVKGDTTLIARYPVCLSRVKGQKEKEGDMKTPSCTIDNPFTITEIKDASTWTHDFGDGRGAILSYGHWFMRLATPHNGIGIHGNTGNEDKMPGRDSEGCIRLTDAGIDHFKQHYAKKGMKVIIKAENQGRYPFETPAIKSPGKPISETETKGA